MNGTQENTSDNDESQYQPLWDIADGRWKMLCMPLHVVGVFLKSNVFQVHRALISWRDFIVVWTGCIGHLSTTDAVTVHIINECL